MDRITLLEQLKLATQQATENLLLPVRQQQCQDQGWQEERAPEVYLMRLPDESTAKKKVPYILHQIITGKDVQPAGERVQSSATVRSIFCVYARDSQEGGLMLLNTMERLRIHLLENVVLGRQFELDLQAGVETLIYPDDTAPYYAGEMATEWKMPATERKVKLW